MLKKTAISLLKKTPIAIALMALPPFASAGTDWPKLLQETPRAIYGSAILNEAGTLRGDLAKLPNGKYRLVKLTDFYGKHIPIIYVDTIPGMPIDQLCHDSLVLRAKFKAQLKLAVLPKYSSTSLFESAKWTPNIDEKKTNSSVLNTASIERIELENPFTVSSLQISYAKYLPYYVRYPLDPSRGSHDGRAYDFYKALLQSESEKQAGGEVVIDLTEHNGFACDLMLNNIELRADATVEYETGMPDRTEWLKKDYYQKMFQLYWKNVTTFSQLQSVNPHDPATAAFLAGISSTVFDGDEVAKKPTRVQALIHSYEFGMDGLSLSERGALQFPQIENNFYLTIDIAMPKYLLNHQPFLTTGSAASTQLMKD